MPRKSAGGPGPGKTPATGRVTPDPARGAADPCPVGDGVHYIITESDGARVCQKCGKGS